MDEDLKKQIESTLHLSRVSLSEHFLVEAVHMSTKDIAAATTTVNKQIKGWGLVKLSFEDVNPKLWELCQAITAGKVVA